MIAPTVTSKGIRFTYREYLRMSDAGVFAFDGRRAELMRGRVFRMNAQAHPHRWAMTKIANKFMRSFLPQHHWVVTQGTLPLDKYNAPEPDLYILDVPVGTPESQSPRPSLVLEVSRKSYVKDSTIKLSLYAWFSIPEYWIVNLNEKRVEIYREPNRKEEFDSTYESIRFAKLGGSLNFVVFPDVSMNTDDLLP